MFLIRHPSICDTGTTTGTFNSRGGVRVNEDIVSLPGGLPDIVRKHMVGAVLVAVEEH